MDLYPQLENVDLSSCAPGDWCLFNLDGQLVPLLICEQHQNATTGFVFGTMENGFPAYIVLKWFGNRYRCARFQTPPRLELLSLAAWGQLSEATDIGKIVLTEEGPVLLGKNWHKKDQFANVNLATAEPSSGVPFYEGLVVNSYRLVSVDDAGRNVWSYECKG